MRGPRFIKTNNVYANIDNNRKEARRLLLAGTHKIVIDREKGTAKLVKLPADEIKKFEHELKDIDAVCREIYGDNWRTVPYWYIDHVREQAIRVLDWIAIREYL